MIMQNAKWIYYYYFLVIFIREKAAGSKDLCVRRGAHFKIVLVGGYKMCEGFYIRRWLCRNDPFVLGGRCGTTQNQHISVGGALDALLVYICTTDIVYVI